MKAGTSPPEANVVCGNINPLPTYKPFNSNFLGIVNLLKYFRINVVFKNASSVRSIFIKNSPNSSPGSIYTIPCKDCNQKYIGQTGKELELRIKQHQYSVRTGQLSNALFVHMNDNNHSIDWNASSVVFCCGNLVQRNLIESALIKCFNDNIMNVSPGLFKLDSYIVNVLAKKFKIDF